MPSQLHRWPTSFAEAVRVVLLALVAYASYLAEDVEDKLLLLLALLVVVVVGRVSVLVPKKEVHEALEPLQEDQ